MMDDPTFLPRKYVTKEDGSVETVPIYNSREWPLSLLKYIYKFAKKTSALIRDDEVAMTGVLSIRLYICFVAEARRAIEEVPKDALEYGILKKDVRK